MTGQQFKYRLESILEHNAVPKHREREKSGKINSGRLGRYGVTSRLFSRKSMEKKEKEYSIALLVDASGSMSDSFDDSGESKINIAQDVVCMLAHSLAKIKGVSFEITIFNGLVMQAKSFDELFDEKSFRSIYSTVYKGYHTSYLNNKGDMVDSMSPTPTEEDKMLRSQGYNNLGWRENNASQNYDGLAIYRIYRRLVPRSGKRVIMTFSDGSPTVGQLFYNCGQAKTLRGDKIALDILRSGPNEAITKAIHAMKREDVETIGIGIGTDHVKRFYKYTAIVYSKREFFSRTLVALSKVFKKIN